MRWNFSNMQVIISNKIGLFRRGVNFLILYYEVGDLISLKNTEGFEPTKILNFGPKFSPFHLIVTFLNISKYILMCTQPISVR